MPKLLVGFKEFIMRGNVVDLAVGIVIGAAFTTVVTAFTDAFIKPLIKLFGGGGEFGATFTINHVNFDWGAFLNALVTFVITAAVLYFLVVTPLNRLAERRARGQEPAPKAPPEDIQLLREIRDALLDQRAANPVAGSATGSATAAATPTRPGQTSPAPKARTPDEG